FEAAGEPGSAFGPLAAAREAFLDERYLEVQDLLEKRFWPALETAREVGTASTARLAKLRTTFEGDLERSRTEIARYLSAVRGDGEVPSAILTSHGKAFEARVDKLVPSRAEHVLRALRQACDASGDALRPALGAVTDAAAKCRTELSVIRGSSPELEKSAFGSFAVHAHLDASLESIIGAATSMAGREA
ncbi:MAG: hypothetical protein H6734_14655, partial [Alphaproteobacteria bacterium]|nr:hypothetical protein [Alphaproteobacteria bacterium]